MNSHELILRVREYEQSFTSFINVNNLPKEWFSVPDHIAIKCADGKDYVKTCRELSHMTKNGIWEIDLDSRFLGSAELINSINFGEYGFSWIEIMQPRPGKETKEGFVEHTEFLFTDFNTVKNVLDRKNIAYELQENPGHKWINIVIDNYGREIKVNDKVLSDVVKWELEKGHLKKRDDS
ncbi:hypothetical protein H6800_01795 [Candidatus Nomurabacteria bacterium]|nr:hypothetical protein [Candidatus Nomurabacteria bacterium]